MCGIGLFRREGKKDDGEWKVWWSTITGGTAGMEYSSRGEKICDKIQLM